MWHSRPRVCTHLRFEGQSALAQMSEDGRGDGVAKPLNVTRIAKATLLRRLAVEEADLDQAICGVRVMIYRLDDAGNVAHLDAAIPIPGRCNDTALHAGGKIAR